MTLTEIEIAPRGAPAPPGDYMWLVRRDDGSTAYARTTTAAVASLIADYDVEDPTAAFEQRWSAAAATANVLQSMYIDDARVRGIDMATLGEEALTALLTDRHRVLPDACLDEVWEHDVPLVVLGVDFEPYTSAPVPTGRVLVIDPSDEVALLDSLTRCGAIEAVRMM